MKQKHWTTLVIGVAVALGVYALPALAQQAGQPAASDVPTRVAVIDVLQVIKAHPDFLVKQAALEEQIKQADAAFTKRREAIENKQKALQASQLRVGSPEHQRALDDINEDLANFDKDGKAQQRRFLLDNSRIMYETYQDIKATIARVAMNAGIAQVTDYREMEVNPAIPETVAEDMDQRLVWFNPRLNITQSIINQLYTDRNRQPPAQTAAGAARTATAPAPSGVPAGQSQFQR